MRISFKAVLFNLVIPLLALGGIALAAYYYNQLQTLKSDPQVLAEQEAKEWAEKIGKLILLPEGETPTLATVSDPEALKKDQPFFNQAEAGDKVLIYTTARKAILYSVSKSKIIEVAPVNIGAQDTVTPPAPKAPESSSDSQ